MNVVRDLPSVSPRDLIVDNTILTDTRKCQTLTAMRHVLGLATPSEAVELRCGSAVHEGLARYLVTGSAKKALARFDAAYQDWAASHAPKVDRDGKPHRLLWAPVHRILAHWLDAHPLNRWPLIVDPAHVEVPVWGELGVLINGKLKAPDTEIDGGPAHTHPSVEGRVLMVALLDAIGKTRAVGGYWSIDHKTTSRIGDWFKQDQEDSSQFTGQLWLARQREIVGLHGVYINALELPRLNSSDRTCRDHGVPYKKCALAHIGSMLFPITRSSHEIENWESTARSIARTFLKLKTGVRDVHDVRELPMDGRFTRACGRCTFREWCRIGRPAHGASAFVEQRWNPLDHAWKRGGTKDAA